MYKREKVTNILVNSKVTSFLFFRTLGLVTSETSYTVPVPTWFVLVSRNSLGDFYFAVMSRDSIVAEVGICDWPRDEKMEVFE